MQLNNLTAGQTYEGIEHTDVGAIKKSENKIWFQCTNDYTYQHTDSEKYSTLSDSKNISSQSSAFFSNQSITI